MEPYRRHRRHHLWPTHEGRAATGTLDEAGIPRVTPRTPIYSPLPPPSSPGLQQQHPQPQPQLQLQPPRLQHEYYSSLRQLSLAQDQTYSYQQLRGYQSAGNFCHRNHTPEPFSDTGNTSTCQRSPTISSTCSDSHGRHINSRNTNWRFASTAVIFPVLDSPFRHNQQHQRDSAACGIMDGSKPLHMSDFRVPVASPGHTSSFSIPEDHNTMAGFFNGDDANPVSSEGDVLRSLKACSCSDHDHSCLHVGCVSSLPRNSDISLQAPLPTSSFLGPLYDSGPSLTQHLPAFSSHPFRPPVALPRPVVSNPAVAAAYCFDRGGGLFTPLIPADLLPSMVGISRHVNGCCGMIVLQDPSPTATLPEVQPPPSFSGLRSASVVGGPTVMPPSHFVPQQIDAYPPAHMPMAHIGYRHAKRNKVYCDKWVHEGICAFTQQGCKFKHEMPHDRATQQSLGLFHGYPAWYKKYQNETFGTGSRRTQVSPAGIAAEIQSRVPPLISMQDGHGVSNIGSGTAGNSLSQGAIGLSSGVVFDRGGSRRPGSGNMSWWPQQQPVQKEGGGESGGNILERMVSSMVISSAEQPDRPSARAFARQPAVPFTIGRPYRPHLSHEASILPGSAPGDFGPIAPPSSSPAPFVVPQNTVSGAAFPSTPPHRDTNEHSVRSSISDEHGEDHA